MNPSGFRTINDRIINLPGGLIAEVILGISISKRDADEIIEICKERKIRIFKAKKIFGRYEVDRDEI